MYANPLYRLLASRRMAFDRTNELCTGYSTACWRGYCGTWQVIGDKLYLMHLSTMWPDEGPMPAELMRKFLRVVPANGFPIFACWFNGRLRIQLGRRLVYSHHGWSHWFERERVMTFKHGLLIRDREVDTRRILEWYLRRDPRTNAMLEGTLVGPPIEPLVWFEREDEQEDYFADWWPPDYPFRLRNGAGGGGDEIAPRQATMLASGGV